MSLIKKKYDNVYGQVWNGSSSDTMRWYKVVSFVQTRSNSDSLTVMLVERVQEISSENKGVGILRADVRSNPNSLPLTSGMGLRWLVKDGNLTNNNLFAMVATVLSDSQIRVDIYVRIITYYTNFRFRILDSITRIGGESAIETFIINNDASKGIESLPTESSTVKIVYATN